MVDIIVKAVTWHTDLALAVTDLLSARIRLFRLLGLETLHMRACARVACVTKVQAVLARAHGVLWWYLFKVHATEIAVIVRMNG